MNNPILLILTLGILICPCCKFEYKKDASKIKIENKIISKIDSTKTLKINIETLKGIWKYTEVRTSLTQKGPAPAGEILLGITEDYELSFATQGMEELEGNLKFIPSDFKIANNALVPTDLTSKIDFKRNFANETTTVHFVSQNELILGKGKVEKKKPRIYMYFQRIN